MIFNVLQNQNRKHSTPNRSSTRPNGLRPFTLEFFFLLPIVPSVLYEINAFPARHRIVGAVSCWQRQKDAFAAFSCLQHMNFRVTALGVPPRDVFPLIWSIFLRYAFYVCASPYQRPSTMNGRIRDFFSLRASVMKCLSLAFAGGSFVPAYKTGY